MIKILSIFVKIFDVFYRGVEELAGGHDPGGADAGLQQAARGLRGGVGGAHEGVMRDARCDV